ncbi:hypothetical protein [Stappia phage SI01]|uniref:Uncharacterized protein n=1 Tax=Stappia phage SI01 TaxID=2847766 RepID=A0AAE7VHJ9_9CAUD|nr:hypothetical protein [Stappia phage SI01]
MSNIKKAAGNALQRVKSFGQPETVDDILAPYYRVIANLHDLAARKGMQVERLQEEMNDLNEAWSSKYAEQRREVHEQNTANALATKLRKAVDDATGYSA